MVRNDERRSHPRFDVSFPISFTVFGGVAGGGQRDGIEGIGTRTAGRVGNISLEGMLIEANPTRDQISKIIRAKQGHDRFDIQIEANFMDENVRVTGKVVWYDINFLEDAPYHFRAGIFLEEMDRTTREIWQRLVARVGN